MLAYVLALAVALGSFALYMAAFFFPEVHRKYDFIWSGVGFFYALVLWFYAGRITGGVLLGQMASVTLLGWFGWQTLLLRREAMPAAQRTALPDSTSSWGEVIQTRFQQVRARLPQNVPNLSAGNSSVGNSLGSLPQQANQAITGIKNWVQGLIGSAQKPKQQVKQQPKQQAKQQPPWSKDQPWVRPTTPPPTASSSPPPAAESAPPTPAASSPTVDEAQDALDVEAKDVEATAPDLKSDFSDTPEPDLSTTPDRSPTEGTPQAPAFDTSSESEENQESS